MMTSVIPMLQEVATFLWSKDKLRATRIASLDAVQVWRDKQLVEKADFNSLNGGQKKHAIQALVRLSIAGEPAAREALDRAFKSRTQPPSDAASV
jgi:hypothetical protein